MNRLRYARHVYRLLLVLHPRAFRERFAQEMLWVFDQSALETGAQHLIADGMMSAVKQWMSDDAMPRRATATGLFQIPYSPSMNARRLAQAVALSALVTLGFFKLLTQSVPLPKPPQEFKVRRAEWELCSPAPHADHHRGAAHCKSFF